MKLKHKLTKEDFEFLKEDTKKFYEEQDGVYYLQVDGMVPKARLDEFRENNINLMEENATLKKDKEKIAETIKQFEGLTVEELSELRKKAEKSGKGENGLSEEEMKAAIDAEVSKRTKSMREEYENQYSELQTKYGESQNQLTKLVIDQGLSSAAIEAGVLESALPDVLLRGSQVYKLEDGKAVPYKGEEVIYGKDGETPQTMKEWMTELSSVAPHLFKETQGTGMKQQGSHSQKTGGANENKLRGTDRMRAAHGS